MFCRTNVFLVIFLTLPLRGLASPVSECKYRELRVDNQGDQRIFSRCRSSGDCEVFASFSKKDLENYSQLIQGTNNASAFLIVAATMVGGGMTSVGARAGRLILSYPKEAVKNLFSSLEAKTSPAAGLLKSMIEKEFPGRGGQYAANLFSKSTYIATFTGVGGLTLPSAAANVEKTVNIALDAVRVHENSVVSGKTLPVEGDCVDKLVNYVSDLKDRLENRQNFAVREQECLQMSLGPERARCREQLEKDRDAYRIQRQERVLPSAAPSNSIR